MAPPASTRMVVALAAAAGCGTEGGALESARQSGLRAGYANEPPYALVDSAGHVTGEAPEILRHSAEALEIAEIEWVPLEFPELIPALLTGRIDVIAAGMFITPDRRDRVRFSRATACVRPVLVEPTPSASADPGPSGGAACPACRIVVLHGSVEQAALEEMDSAVAEVLVVPDIGTAIAAIRAGSADALAISGPTGRELAAHYPWLFTREDPFTAEVAERAAGCAAFGFRPGEEDLAAAFDSVLDAFIGSRAHLELIRPLGFTRREIPCPSDPGQPTGEAPAPCFRAPDPVGAP